MIGLTFALPRARFGDWAEIPISWRPATTAGFLPSFDGKLGLTPRDARTTRLTVSGTYRPPLKSVGQNLDEVVQWHRRLFRIWSTRSRARSSSSCPTLCRTHSATNPT